MTNQDQVLAVGSLLICIKEHPDGDFTLEGVYKVNAYHVVGGRIHARIRDDRRQRKDFNFIPTSKNYIWDYFFQVNP